MSQEKKKIITHMDVLELKFEHEKGNLTLELKATYVIVVLQTQLAHWADENWQKMRMT